LKNTVVAVPSVREIISSNVNKKRKKKDEAQARVHVPNNNIFDIKIFHSVQLTICAKTFTFNKYTVTNAGQVELECFLSLNIYCLTIFLNEQGLWLHCQVLKARQKPHSSQK
jgi:CRISPR/Cas system CMR-associated protein Cmr3 (group 5 of RAMP superfamily)